MIEHIENVNQYDEAIKEGKVLVDFFAVWCGSCMMLTPIVEELSEEHPEVKWVKVDVDKTPELAMRYGIGSIPTLLLFENGQLVDKTLGFMPKANLKKFVRID